MTLNSLPVSPLPVVFKGPDGLHSWPLLAEAVKYTKCQWTEDAELCLHC